MVFAMLMTLSAAAQSTDDVRFTYGEGPFPLYLAGSIGAIPVEPLFGDFVRDYISDNNPDVIAKNQLHTREVILGAAINCTHCLALKGVHIRNFGIELGFMNAVRKMDINPGHQLHLVESTGSFRLIYRFTKFYPLTMQAHAGLNYYSFYQVREVIESGTISSFRRVRDGSSITENHDSKFTRAFPGYNFRLRMALFDPSGAGGGLGIYAEGIYQGKWYNENFRRAYNLFELSTEAPPGERRNYFRLGFGVIIPLALTMY